MSELVNNLNLSHYEDLRPWNNNIMLRSGANIFVSQILVQGRCGELHGQPKTEENSQKTDSWTQTNDV